MSKIGFYPPFNVSAELVDSISELPESAKLEDYNEFYKLFRDSDDILYVYRIKCPKSPLMEEIERSKNE